jgi:hypothetical protein
MSDVVPYRGHTISVNSIFVGADRWGASYTVRNGSKMIQRSNDVPFQSSPQLAESAAFVIAIQYVEDLVKHAQSSIFPNGC